jgi:hypothetical protein
MHGYPCTLQYSESNRKKGLMQVGRVSASRKKSFANWPRPSCADGRDLLGSHPYMDVPDHRPSVVLAAAFCTPARWQVRLTAASAAFRRNHLQLT